MKILGDIQRSKCTTVVVDTNGKWKKICNQNSSNYFIWTPLGSTVNINIIFFLQVHFKVKAVWYCSHYLQSVSMTPAVPVAKFTAGVVDTSKKFATGVVDTSGAPWLANISTNFQQIWNDPNNIFRGACRKMIHEKNLKQKISWHCPVKPFVHGNGSILAPPQANIAKASTWQTQRRQRERGKGDGPYGCVRWWGAGGWNHFQRRQKSLGFSYSMFTTEEN